MFFERGARRRGRKLQVVAPSDAMPRLHIFKERPRNGSVCKQEAGRTREHYQSVESRRVDGEPRQKVLVHLGEHPTVDDALKKRPRENIGRRA